MRHIVTLLFTLICMLTLTSCVNTKPQHNDGSVKVSSDKFVHQWLAALDKKDSDALWSMTSKILKNRISKDLMIKSWLGRKASLGKTIHIDEQVNWEYKNYYSNMPDGIYRRISHWTEYKHKKLSKEMFIVSFEDGEWKLVTWR